MRLQEFPGTFDPALHSDERDNKEISPSDPVRLGGTENYPPLLFSSNISTGIK